MARVNLEFKMRVGPRKIKVKQAKFLSTIADSYIEATAVQFRILAHTFKDLVIDKLLAYTPEIGFKVLKRKSGVKKPLEPMEETVIEEKTSEDLVLEKNKLLPPYNSPRPTEPRIPFPMEKHSPDYLHRKVRKGLDPRLLMASGDYLRGIVVRKKDHPKYKIYYEVRMAKRKHATGIELKELAKILEYGVSGRKAFLFGNRNHEVIIKTPPRPHWSPAFREIKQVVERLGTEIRAKALKTALAKLR